MSEEEIRKHQLTLLVELEKSNQLILESYRNAVDSLYTQNKELLLALQEFCGRVENGEVRSKKTYSRFKELLRKYNGT